MAVKHSTASDASFSATGATAWDANHTIEAGTISTTELGGDITTAGKALLDDADASAQRTTLGLGTLATQNGTFSGTSSGTNTGDQTSIVGITGTIAQFNTACTDADFATGGGTATGTNTGDQTAASLGLGSSDSPQFAGVNLGHATDTTLTRVSAGVMAVEGATVYTQGGALGTPASGVLTNCTGTAAGLTAGTVTTNANLTGPITSTGNATAIASQTGTGTKFVMSGSPTLDAGTTAVPAFTLTAGTNLTTAAAGAVEFDGTCFYDTAVASTRQVRNTEQFSLLTASFQLANSNSAQAYLETSQDTFTVPGSTTFQFETIIEIEGMGGTTRTTGFLFGGTATFTSCNYISMWWSGNAGAAAAGQQTKFNNVATVQILHPTSTAAAHTIWIRGTFAINGAGTLIPQIQFSADPTGTIIAAAGTFFRCWPIGSNTVTKVGNIG